MGTLYAYKALNWFLYYLPVTILMKSQEDPRYFANYITSEINIKIIIQ